MPVLLIQVCQTRNIYSHFVDSVDILWFVRQFLVSSAWTLFFLPRTTVSWASYFFCWSDLFFKSQVFMVCRISHGGDFHFRHHPAAAKKRSRISFFPPFSVSFSFLVLALAVKYRRHVSTKSGSLRDSWYPIGDAIVVMVLVLRPTYQTNMAQGLFKGGSWRRVGAQTSQTFQKMPQTPSPFP